METDYAFYRYQRNRNNGDLDKELHSSNFSLSLMLTSLSKTLETDLREFISKRLSKGSIFEGQGNISAVVIGGTGEEDECTDSLCYYCLLSHERDELASLLTDVTSQQIAASDEYIVCLVTSNNVNLDLFRPELDSFSRRLVDLLEPDLLLELELREELGQMEGLENKLQQVLTHWFPEVTRYLSRCLHILGGDVKYLIYCALLGIQLDLKCSDLQLKADIFRFIQCCSLSDLLSTLTTTADPQHSDSSCSETGAVMVKPSPGTSDATPPAQKTSLVIDNNGHRFHNCGCTGFCVEWSTVLLTGETHNPVFIKQIIENYKLRAIQDMNNLKRMLKQAEADYYSLYRCYNFLVGSGNEAILLRHARNEAQTSGHRDSLGTLSVLQDFIQQQQQLVPS